MPNVMNYWSSNKLKSSMIYIYVLKHIFNMAQSYSDKLTLPPTGNGSVNSLWVNLVLRFLDQGPKLMTHWDTPHFDFGENLKKKNLYRRILFDEIWLMIGIINMIFTLLKLNFYSCGILGTKHFSRTPPPMQICAN